MRWWMHFDPPVNMCVDNAVISGMDFSELLVDDPDLYHINWQEGRGEIERQIVDANDGQGANLNGLREQFVDVTPYVPIFQQFLTRLKDKDLLLDQAKKVQVDLIKVIFEVQRQAPYHYPVAAGDYWWDASDDAMFAGSLPTIQNTITKINEIIARLNSAIPGLNSIDSSIVSQINSNVVAIGDQLVASINWRIVNQWDPNSISLRDEINNGITTNGNLARNHINDTILGDAGSGTNTINVKLQGTTRDLGDGSYQYYASPGLSASIGKNTWPFANVSNYTVSQLTDDFLTISYGGGVSWTPITDVAATNVQWIPIGHTSAVPVTPPEASAIMQGIANRTNQLVLIRNQKIAEVNALTTVDDVIAYDVLADWPPITLPPAFSLDMISPSSSISATIIGTPTAPTEGVPEAPNDGVTYGRRNLAWNPALALSGDVLDGGTF